MKKYFIVFVIFYIFIPSLFMYAQDYTMVNVRERVSDSNGNKTYTNWKAYKTRTIDHLSGFSNSNIPEKSKFGGRKDKSEMGTGFYYTKKINNRWWIIDPDGYLFFHIGVVTVRPGTSDNQVKELKAKFGDEKKWLAETVNLLISNGFNGTGNWSNAELLKESSTPLAYTRGLNYMAGYGKKRGGTFQQPGHTGYPKDLIFVFDPEFEIYCDVEAQKVAKYKDEKNLLGYFSDNEMPFPEDALDKYLQLDKKDPGYQAAEKWIISQNGKSHTMSDISVKEREAFLEYMSEKYFSVVSKALKKYDPNHMYLGCRFYGKSLSQKPIFKSAGKYMDIISVNYYGVWTPKIESLNNWATWSGKPIIITEWYTKAEDSGMPNQSGAGWIVATQKDRGLFYQNFTLALLQSKVCVGWHWFKYQDNDIEDKKSDPSNLDANKGIVNSLFIPYQPLLDEMVKINKQVYGLIDYFDINK